MPDKNLAEDDRPVPSQAEGDDPPAAGQGDRPTPSQAEGEQETVDESLRQKERRATAQVKLYGADWCGMTRRARAHLHQLGVPYEYINIDDDRRAAEWVRRHNNGKEKKPTIEIAGTVLTTPGNQQLEEVLRREQLLPG
jgi:mycoredoxin